MRMGVKSEGEGETDEQTNRYRTLVVSLSLPPPLSTIAQCTAYHARSAITQRHLAAHTGDTTLFCVLFLRPACRISDSKACHKEWENMHRAFFLPGHSYCRSRADPSRTHPLLSAPPFNLSSIGKDESNSSATFGSSGSSRYGLGKGQYDVVCVCVCVWVVSIAVPFPFIWAANTPPPPPVSAMRCHALDWSRSPWSLAFLSLTLLTTYVALCG